MQAMKRILVALLVVSCAGTVAFAQEPEHAAQPKAGGMPMMGQGMMPGMMGQPQVGAGQMMPGMMGQGMMPCSRMGQCGCGGMRYPMMGGMPPMMGGMMPRHVRGCHRMAEGMTGGAFEMDRIRKELDLSEEQAGKVRAVSGGMQRQAVRNMSAWKIAELDLADLISADTVDMAKVEAKLKEIEAIRSALRLEHIRAAEEVRKLLTKEQLQKFEEMHEKCCGSMEEPAGK